MIFESVNVKYEVINLTDEFEEYAVYLCRCGNVKYTICCLKSEKLKKRICPLLIKMQEIAGYDDLVDIFTDRNDICAVFRYDECGTTFNEVCDDESLSLGKKLDIVYRFCSDLCIRNIPFYMAADMLKNSNVGVRNDGRIGFCYRLCEMEQYADSDMTEFCRIFGGIIQKLFKAEKREFEIDEIDKFADGIINDTPADYIELFGRFQRVYTELCDKINSGKLKSRNKGVRIWSRLKVIVPMLKNFVIGALLILACFILARTLFTDKNSDKETIKSIGSIIVEENIDSK